MLCTDHQTLHSYVTSLVNYVLLISSAFYQLRLQTWSNIIGSTCHKAHPELSKPYHNATISITPLTAYPQVIRACFSKPLDPSEYSRLFDIAISNRREYYWFLSRPHARTHRTIKAVSPYHGKNLT